jgi:hypothetical protein
MLPSSITAIMLAAVLFFVGFFLPSSSLATAQLEQQQQQQTTTTTTTTTPPPSSLSITTTPPLTPEEQEQQNRLQGVIAATTRDLNETEKQIAGVVFTPRWSEPLWVNPNSIAVIIAYCLPGEFADSGQEILGGFGLEVLESYAVDLPQGFMAWMAVVGNQADDVQQNGRRLPAAVGVICASDLNNTESRILSPQEQQEINNINQQFTTIQNTQITNIDQVINVIDNVTAPPQNGTGGGGGMTPTTTTEQPLRAEIIPNATEGLAPATIRFDSNVRGGIPPYIYIWRDPGGGGVEEVRELGYQRSLVLRYDVPGTNTITLTVYDSINQTASDTVPITLKERPPTNDTGTTTGQPLTVEIIPNATSGFVQDRFELKTNLTGGTPPYFYDWDFDSTDLTSFACSYDAFVDGDNSCLMIFTNAQPLTHEVAVTVRDSVGKTASDTIQITVRERLPGGAIAPEPGGVAPPIEGLSPRVPPTNDTGAASASATEPPLMAEAIANATQAVAPATIRFDANITGGAPPYSYSWSDPNLGLIDLDRSITLNFFEPGTFTYGLTVVDSRGKTVTDNVQIVISERGLPTEGIVAPEPGGIAPPPLEGGGVSPGVPEGGEGGEPEGGVSPPSTTEEQGGGEEPSPPPPSDDTEEGEGTPPSTTEEGGEEPPSSDETGGG